MIRGPQIIHVTRHRKKREINWRKIIFVVIAVLVVISMVIVELAYLLDYARR